MVEPSNVNLVTLTVDITRAYLNHNQIAASELPAVIEAIHAAFEKASQPAAIDASPPEPAVSVRASVKPDYLICLEDGRKLTMLKRYLRTRYNLTPEEYRARWGLPRDYPMVAPAYSSRRSTLARASGLGRNPVVEPEPSSQAPNSPEHEAPRAISSSAAATSDIMSPASDVVPVSQTPVSTPEAID